MGVKSNHLYKAKKTELIHDVWSYNGIVFAKLKDNDRPTKFNNLANVQIFLETVVNIKIARDHVANLSSSSGTNNEHRNTDNEANTPRQKDLSVNNSSRNISGDETVKSKNSSDTDNNNAENVQNGLQSPTA